MKTVADRHRLAAYHNKHCRRASREYQHRWPWMTLNPKNMGFKWFFAILGCDAHLRVNFRWNILETQNLTVLQILWLGLSQRFYVGLVILLYFIVLHFTVGLVSSAVSRPCLTLSLSLLSTFNSTFYKNPWLAGEWKTLSRSQVLHLCHRRLAPMSLPAHLPRTTTAPPQVHSCHH